ncbi:hypothetical protein Tco_1017027 [Tanacetum coccineum]|uniref:Uncharacterized protein n=1 Tax=Tanacetum coccineum TaxID=301880 RepID=A0ABQ5FSA2_9ASTR
MVCKMGKGSRNKKKVMENIMYFNYGAGPSSFIGIPLTQEEAEKRALAQNISMRYEILEEVRSVIETLAYNDKYRKLLDEIWADKLGRDDIMKEDKNITMINYTEAEVTGRLVNVLCQVGFTTLFAKFLILEIPVDRDAPIVMGRRFLDTIGGNIDIPNMIFTTFDRHTRSLPVKLRDVEWKPDYKLCYSNPELATGHWKTEIRTYDHEAGTSRAKRSRNVETVEEALLPDVHHKFLEWRGCSREAKSRYNSRLATLLPKLIYSPQIVDWQLLHKIGYGDEIDQILKIKLFREFYATYEFDEEFARRLRLYHAEELEEEGFDTYFQGGLRSDENFNAKEYWERISIDRDLHLSRSSITSIRFSILRVLHEMITYGLCQRTTGYEKIKRNDLWLLSMFEDRHQNGYANVAWIARKSRVLTEETMRSLSTLVYCRDLDRTTLRELIDSEDRLIPKIPVDDVPRVAAQKALRVQYQGVFEHMAGVYIVSLQGAYNPPGYAHPQYDQYY